MQRDRAAARKPAAAGRPEQDWDIQVGPAHLGATEAYLARATPSEGTPAVIKVVVRASGTSRCTS